MTNVRPAAFGAQMTALNGRGWKTSGIANDEHLPSNPTTNKTFALIFDDGYECVYENAFPLLESLGFKALVFVPTGYIGRWNDWDHQLLGRRHRHLTLAVLKELIAAGWMAGSHGMKHLCLTHLSDSDLREELGVSKDILEQSLGARVDWCAFPFGRYDRRVLKVAADMGYRGAIVPVRRNSNTCDGFVLIEGDAIYSWDTPAQVIGTVERDKRQPMRRFVRRQANRLSAGTILWRRIIPQRTLQT